MVCEKLTGHGHGGLTGRQRAMDSRGRSRARAPVTGRPGRRHPRRGHGEM